jgi:hypothetical protein
VSIIACIEDPSIITKILAHLDAQSGAPVAVNQLPEPCRQSYLIRYQDDRYCSRMRLVG